MGPQQGAGVLLKVRGRFLIKDGREKMKKFHNHNLKKESRYFLEKLKESGGRITLQRRALLKEIIKFQGPFSADDLLGKLKKTPMDLATIYRSLTAFKELGLLSTVDFSDGTLRYQYIPEKEHRHYHHVVCTDCRSVQPIKSCIVHKQEELIEQMGYRDVSHRLEFFGLCKKCAG